MSKEDFRQFGGSTPELSINGLKCYGRLHESSMVQIYKCMIKSMYE